MLNACSAVEPHRRAERIHHPVATLPMNNQSAIPPAWLIWVVCASVSVSAQRPRQVTSRSRGNAFSPE